MRIRVYWAGKIKEPHCRELFDRYWSRLGHLVPCALVEARDRETLLKAAEKDSSRSFSIVLDAAGRQCKSSEFAEIVRRQQDGSIQELRIFVGDHEGLPEAILEKANLRLSLSRMTFPHDLARVMMAEQLYRAMTIIKGFPYSR